jgi:hypothetical protein
VPFGESRPALQASDTRIAHAGSELAVFFATLFLFLLDQDKLRQKPA